jgi:hypothetical protein
LVKTEIDVTEVTLKGKTHGKLLGEGFEEMK